MKDMKLLVAQASSVPSYLEPSSLETSLHNQAPALDIGLLKGILFLSCSLRPLATSRTLPLESLCWGPGPFYIPRGTPLRQPGFGGP